MSQACWSDAQDNAWGTAWPRVTASDTLVRWRVRRSPQLPLHLLLDPTKELNGHGSAAIGQTTATTWLASRNSQKQQEDTLDLESQWHATNRQSWAWAGAGSPQ